MFFFDGFKEKKTNDPRVQVIFERSRLSKISIFIFGQSYYELPKKNIGDSGIIYHIFKTNKFTVVENLYEDKASMDMTLFAFHFLIFNSWIEKHQPLTNGMTKGKFMGRYRSGLNSIFVPDNSFSYYFKIDYLPYYDWRRFD